MPVIHDPAPCTPERIRAAAALHRLGIVQLLFALVLILVCLVAAASNISFILFVVFLPAVTGISMLAAVPMICRERRLGVELGSVAVAVSVLHVALASKAAC